VPVTEEEKSTTQPLPVEDFDPSGTSKDKTEEQKVYDTANEVSPEEPSLEVEEKDLFNRMMEVGVFYGRSKSKTNPLSRKYILTTRSGFEVIDIQGAISHLKDASEVLKKAVTDGGLVLFVGTSPAAKRIIKDVAVRLEFPYVTERWLGGTLTNFKTITDRINYFKKLKDDKSSGRLDKYTKKERLKIDKELAKLDKLFGGIENLDKLPSLMFIADLSENEYAAREAKQKGVPIIALLNTDANPNLVDHPIPANDRNPKSIALLMEYLEQAADEGKQQAILNKESSSAKASEDRTEDKSKGKVQTLPQDSQQKQSRGFSTSKS